MPVEEEWSRVFSLKVHSVCGSVPIIPRSHCECRDQHHDRLSMHFVGVAPVGLSHAASGCTVLSRMG